MSAESIDPAAVAAFMPLLELLQGPIGMVVAVLAVTVGAASGLARQEPFLPLMGLGVAAAISWAPVMVGEVILGGALNESVVSNAAPATMRPILQVDPGRPVGSDDGLIVEGWSLPEPTGDLVEFEHGA